MCTKVHIRAGGFSLENPKIIKCGDVVFFTVEPYRIHKGILPSEEDLRFRGIGVRVWQPSMSGDFFALDLFSRFATITAVEWDKKIHYVIEYVWAWLVENGHASGPTPDIAEGNLLDILPK